MNSSDFDPGPLADVDYEPEGDQWALVFVRELDHAPDKVWAAITEPAQLSKWAPYTADRALDSVGEVTLTMVDGAESVDLPASLTRAHPPVALEYNWGEDRLRWELAPTATGTRLTLRHTVNDPAMIPKIAAGWHLCVEVADRMLADDPIPPIRGADAMNYGWQDLFAAYSDKLDLPQESMPQDNTGG